MLKTGFESKTHTRAHRFFFRFSYLSFAIRFVVAVCMCIVYAVAMQCALKICQTNKNISSVSFICKCIGPSTSTCTAQTFSHGIFSFVPFCHLFFSLSLFSFFFDFLLLQLIVLLSVIWWRTETLNKTTVPQRMCVCVFVHSNRSNFIYRFYLWHRYTLRNTFYSRCLCCCKMQAKPIRFSIFKLEIYNGGIIPKQSKHSICIAFRFTQ